MAVGRTDGWRAYTAMTGKGNAKADAVEENRARE